MESIRSSRTPFPYVGGKRRLAATLVPLIQSYEHECYAEPFVGAGGVFFRRTRIPPSEVINDKSNDVITFFRILQRHYEAFMDMLKFKVTSRSEFERLTKVDPDTLTDLERAARFLYLQTLSYGGKVAGRAFGVDVLRGGRFNVTLLSQHLSELAERIAPVKIECLDAEEFIRRYDNPKTVFFCDPPYYGTEDYYGAGLFQRETLWRLAASLKSIKGVFIATNLNVPAVREAFSGCDLRVAPTTYSMAGKGHIKEVDEVIIIGGAAARLNG